MIALAIQIVVILTGSAVPASRADEASVAREDQLKAAYLFNFVKFVEWPAGAVDRTLTLCFMGGKGVHDALAIGIENKKIGDRSVVVRRLPAQGNPIGCNVLYIEAGAVFGDWHVRLIGAPSVLTVSDATRFTRRGGMIELFTESNRLRFNINIDNVSKAGLRISSSLLQLAAVVEKGEGR